MSDKPLKDEFNTLKAGYSARLPDKIKSITEDWRLLTHDRQATVLEKLLLKTHSLMGSAPSFGFHAVGDAARTLNTALHELHKRNALIENADLASVNILVEALQQASEQAGDSINDIHAYAVLRADNLVEKKLLYVVEDDEDLAAYLALQLRQHGYDVRIFNKLDGLIETVKKEPPAALVMDIVLTEKGLAGPQAMFYIQKNRSKPLPVIFISARTDMAARLAAVRAGGYAYLAKPINIPVLLEKLHSLTSIRESAVYRILIVDDADRYAPKCATILQQAGMEVRMLNNPVRFLTVLSEFKPMLVLINSQLQGVSGLELAMIIRQQEHTAELPVIFFAENFDHTLRRAVTQKICEDFISESAAPELVVAMVTNRIESTEQLRRISNRDPLTGLYNRQWLLARLQLEAASADTPQALTILYINLDGYKEINKIMGLMAGDAMIVETARLFEEQCGERDVLVRFGDNTFVVLNFEYSLEEVQAHAEKLRVLLKEHVIEMSGRRALTTASIGIALYDSNIGTPEAALLNAATACEEAFRRGGNRVQLHDSIQALKLDRERQDYWHNAIAEAFEKDRFFLVYQPIVNLHGQSSKYFSTLLRMLIDEAGKSAISASEFIEIAEQTQLIRKIDHWVLQRSITAAAEKVHDGDAVNLFVHISAASLTDMDMIAAIKKYLNQARLPGRHIIFMISKVHASAQFRETLYFINKVKALKCRFALRDVTDDDDVQQLVTLLGIEFVKLQNNLIKDINQSPEKQKMLKSVVEKVHDKDAKVIVPLVEDPKALSVLWRHNIDYIEGYFIQAPSESLEYDFNDLGM